MNTSRLSVMAALLLAACGGASTPIATEAPISVPASVPLPAAQVDAARLIHADADPKNWLSYGRTYSEQHFSPLSLINADNAKDLGLAWYADFDSHRGQEAIPIEVDGTLYVSTAWSKVKAFDAKTGKLLWAYDPEVPRAWLVHVCCDAVNRGVAVWQGKVYIGTLDGRLVALDAASGTPIWTVTTFGPGESRAISGAPRVINGMVMIGGAGAEYSVRGYISAYDAETGKLIWRFYTVPGDPSKPPENDAMAMALKTWNGQWWKEGGGGTVWDSMAYDPETDLLYFGTGNGSAWVQAHRSPNGGDNLFVSSLIAVKASTGALVWHYQETPGEVWDFDATQTITLADLVIDGMKRKVLLHAPKSGFFYVLDRETGKLLSASAFAPQTWAKGIDLKTGRPIERAEARYDRTGKLAMQAPGPNGAHNWQPMAFNPDTGIAYIPAQDGAFPYLAEKGYEPKALGFNVGVDFGKVSLPQDAKTVKAALDGEKGWLLAWDPVRQKELWHVDYKGPWNGGVLATGGNLVMQGSTAGDFNVYRADTGERLASLPAQTAVMAGPMTYEVDGEQYVAVTAGWGGAYALSAGIVGFKSGGEHNISRLLVFKLGGTAQLPPRQLEALAPLDPPPATASAARVVAGKELYGRFCGVCHGDAVVSETLNPDLRHTPLLASDSWYDVVLGGVLKDSGMVSFAPVLNHNQAAEIRDYVIQRANEDRDRITKNGRQ